uniref:Uncharacterized protein n=1 Tax=Chromera velia CCMP2878 TaxID=1169474 RepID=A0A0G4GQ68_9ALVE|eukprot:Cvel_722.t1-p1 / transcript=Cvel_722.t1 / gene=Cvel_722 / organism=Chromera_velia_CCMP2878 / gene_product=hypothetical protein / transcript_product=hypothetical protein / location=Cvel_scaffold22:135564-136136(+) / protein_length=191 / sequence_SO=supercontig / SO=protein_coding / is_pseudo=false
MKLFHLVSFLTALLVPPAAASPSPPDSLGSSVAGLVAEYKAALDTVQQHSAALQATEKELKSDSSNKEIIARLETETAALQTSVLNLENVTARAALFLHDIPQNNGATEVAEDSTGRQLGASVPDPTDVLCGLACTDAGKEASQTVQHGMFGASPVKASINLPFGRRLQSPSPASSSSSSTSASSAQASPS